MTQKNQIYKCSICGNIIEILHPGAGTLVCCNKDMLLMSDEVKPEGEEKHIPVIKKEGNKIIIKVGSISHPMTPEHYIERIEIITTHRTYKKFFTPTDEAQASFEINEDIISARAYCNLHGLRKTDF